MPEPSGDIMPEWKFRAMCRKVKMSHEVDKKGQVLRMDVSSLDAPSAFLNYLISNMPSGSGMMKFESKGSQFFVEHDGKRMKTITITSPPEEHRPFVYLDRTIIRPTTKVGWMLSLFDARGCKFA